MPDETQQPESTSDAASESSPQSSGNFADKAKDFFTMGGDKKKWTKALIISAFVVIFMGLGSTAAWGTALAFFVRSIGEPNGNYSGANGECYMPDQYWTDPSAELTVDIIKKRVESYRNVSNPDRDAQLQKLLTYTRSKGYNPAVALAIWGKESTYSSNAKNGHDFGYLLSGWGGFDKQLEGAVSTLDRAFNGTGDYHKKPGVPIQVMWLETYTPSNVAANSEDKKTFFIIVRQAMPGQVVCVSAAGGGAPSGPGYNNVPVFSQTDPRWAAHDYSYRGGGQTIGSGGCGVTAAAMVLKFYDKNVDPVIAADWSKQHGHRAEGGTAYSLFPAIAATYGLKEDQISWDDAAKVLQQGKPLIVSMNSKPVPDPMSSTRNRSYHSFTSGGHFIVLTGINGNTVYINDPEPRGITSASVTDVKTAFEAGYYYIHQ